MIKPIRNTVASIAIAAAILASIPSTALALGKDDPMYKNQYGMRTVKCQVHLNSPGNPVVGFVFGNHKSDAPKAEEQANEFVSRLAPYGQGSKRHCYTQKQYTPSGLYKTDMSPV